MKLLILGAGGHGQVVREIASSTNNYDNISFLDDRFGEDLCPDSVIGNLNDIELQKEHFSHIFIAIGNPLLRREYHEKAITLGFHIPIIFHNSSYISPSCIVKEGTVIMPNVIVQANSKIGMGCIISSGAIIDHDTSIGDFCHVNAGAIVPSNTVVPSMTKIDYGHTYEKPSNSDTNWIEEHKQQFGIEPSFF